jgi:hypothetical protein
MTAEGTPYLVMEYVEGVPLDEYCRANDLSVEAKLELFLRMWARLSMPTRTSLCTAISGPATFSWPRTALRSLSISASPSSWMWAGARQRGRRRG